MAVHVIRLIINRTLVTKRLLADHTMRRERQVVLLQSIRFKVVGWSWIFFLGGAEIMTTIGLRIEEGTDSQP